MVEGVVNRIPQLIERANVPGLSMVMIHAGEEDRLDTYGVRDRATGEPMTPDTLFEAASLSKPVFAYGVLQLCAEGFLDLDRPLDEYYRESYIPDDGVWNGKRGRKAEVFEQLQPETGDTAAAQFVPRMRGPIQ